MSMLKSIKKAVIMKKVLRAMRVVSWLRDIVILWRGFLATNLRKAWAIALPVACLTSAGVGPLLRECL